MSTRPSASTRSGWWTRSLRVPSLFITTDDDRLVPPEESQALYDRAGEPKKLVVLEGYGHYEVYVDPAFTEVMDEALAWFAEHLPPR